MPQNNTSRPGAITSGIFRPWAAARSSFDGRGLTVPPSRSDRGPMGTTVREPDRGPERDTFTRAVKAFFVLVCGGAIVWMLGPAVSQGLDESDLPLVTTLVFLAIMAAPPVLYATLIHRKLPVIVVGAALTALELWSIWAAQTGESSTSGLALIWIPFGGIPLVLIGRIVQTWARRDP